MKTYGFPNAVFTVHPDRTCTETRKWGEEAVPIPRPRIWVAYALRALRTYRRLEKEFSK